MLLTPGGERELTALAMDGQFVEFLRRDRPVVVVGGIQARPVQTAAEPDVKRVRLAGRGEVRHLALINLPAHGRVGKLLEVVPFEAALINVARRFGNHLFQQGARVGDMAGLVLAVRHLAFGGVNLGLQPGVDGLAEPSGGLGFAQLPVGVAQGVLGVFLAVDRPLLLIQGATGQFLGADFLDRQGIRFKPGNPRELIGPEHQSRRGGGADDEQAHDPGEQPGHEGVAAGPAISLFRPADGSGLDRPAVEPASQVRAQFRGGLITQPRLLLQAFQADRLQVARDAGTMPAGRRGDFADHPAHHVGAIVAVDRHAAGEAFVKDHADRVNVRRGRRRVLRVGQRLFRRHVLRRAGHDAGGGQSPGFVEALGDAEVGDLRHPVRIGPGWPGKRGRELGRARVLGRGVTRVGTPGQQDVRGLEVPVDDLVLVGDPHRLRQLLGQHGGAAVRQRAGLQEFRERAAVHVLEREKRISVMPADFVDLHNVGVAQARDRLGLPPKSLEILRRGIFAGQHHLERDDSIQAELPGFVHDPHAAPGDDIHHLVAGNMHIGGNCRAVRFDRTGALANLRVALLNDPKNRRGGRGMVLADERAGRGGRVDRFRPARHGQHHAVNQPGVFLAGDTGQFELREEVIHAQAIFTGSAQLAIDFQQQFFALGRRHRCRGDVASQGHRFHVRFAGMHFPFHRQSGSSRS